MPEPHGHLLEPPGYLPESLGRSPRPLGDVTEQQILKEEWRGLPDPPVHTEYSIELLDEKGKVLWNDRRPASSLSGDLGTSITISGLGPGLYCLRITGVEPDRGELLGEYLLRVERA